MLNFSSLKLSALGFFVFAINLFFVCQTALAQTLSIKDFAVWGGSSTATVFNPKQGVFLKEGSIIKGNIGSNHQIVVKEKFLLSGNLYSGNSISLKENTVINGNLFALKASSAITGPVISSKERSIFNGNLTANGKIEISNDGRLNLFGVRGIVSVPAPTSTNYKGPNPKGGFSNSINLPQLPIMPNITAFDNSAGKTRISNTQILSPGSYGKLELKGNRTITFNGPGNYVFSEIDNSSSNNFVFDLKNTSEGTINLFIVGNAKLGAISVRIINGSSASRIFTEVHGDGLKNSGNAFDIQASGSLRAGTNAWLGNVWAPNGNIKVKGLKTSLLPHIKGALWSGTRVDLEENIVLTYEAPNPEILTFVTPYYPPPAQGKVDAPNNIIGAELTSLTQNTSAIIGIPDNEIFRFDDNGKVMIEIISKTPNNNTLKSQLISLGLTDTIDNGPHSFVITGFFPINLLSQLNVNPLIEYVRPLYPPILNRGQVTTQGDKTMKTDLVRERFGLDGSGVKIGVLSDSYNSKGKAQEDVDQGDLPGLKSTGDPSENPEPVQVLLDYGTSGIDEGRAMLQIVHDVAPKSKLAFRTGFLSAGDFAKGILELADPALPGGKCDVIVDDLSYITEPFFRDGVVAKVVDQVVGEGVTYFTSAGNFGKRSYEAVFNGVTNTAAIPAPAQVHQFGSNASEVYQSLSLKPGNYTIVLQWDDEFHSLGDDGVKTDLDLYLVGTNGFTLFGFNRSNLSQDPFEVCPFTVKEQTDVKLMIARAAGTNNVRFKYIIFRGDALIKDFQTGNSTIVGHANAKGAISVGAMLYDSIPGVTPVWPGVASFSSRGGTFTLENNQFVTRNKPDLIAPNGVNTTVNLGGANFNDGDTYPNFFGTSAAAPHAAAAGALLIQARKKFNLQTTVTPEEIRQQLISSAGKFRLLGDAFNFEGGYGFLRADQATLEIANAKPIVDTIMSVTPGGETGDQPFMVKVVGQYLTENTKIQVGGIPVATNISEDKTEATATVPALNGIDEPFQLFNPAKSVSGEDGGSSEPVYFFGGNQKEVIVKANNKSRLYRTSNPAFDFEVFVDGIPLNQTGITLSELKLEASDLTISSIATQTSRPGNYGIFIKRNSPLQPGDSNLIKKYGIKFVSGTLAIEKIPLKITPKDVQITYGEFPENIEYTYELPAELSNDSVLIKEVIALHKQYIPANGLTVLNGIANDDHDVDFSDFENIGILSSYQSIYSSRKLAYQNGILKPLTESLDISQIGDQRFMVDVNVNSMAQYKLDSSVAAMIPSYRGTMPRGLLNLKALIKGGAEASVPNGQLQPMINGQLQGMVNGQLQAVVNGQLKAMVNGVYVDAKDITFVNGQLLAFVNGLWTPITNGQLVAVVNGKTAEFELSVANGQLQAVVNGQLMPVVNGQLQAVVNGQLVAVVNGQLQAVVNGQLVPVVNGQLVAVVNGQLQPVVNGQLLAVVNGQLMAVVNSELQKVDDLNFVNGQLVAVVNGQLLPIVNGQLKAMVNGVVTDVPTNSLNLVNGQLQAVVNGQLIAMVNGQLQAVVNGQLQPFVNGEAIVVENVTQLANGQLRAVVNGQLIPVVNGQLKAVVNGQLLGMVNGQLMAVVNGAFTFVVFQNGQLQAVVNGQLQPIVNGQLRALVNGVYVDASDITFTNGQLVAVVNGVSIPIANGQLRAVVNGVTSDFDLTIANGQLQAVVNGQLMPLVNGQLQAVVNGQLQAVVNYSIANGQLVAVVNNEEWVFPNGQLKPLVNGQLQPLVNNFDISGSNNNARTMVVVDENDIVLQGGDLGSMFAVPMITGNTSVNNGQQKIIPAAFVNENFEVTYGMGNISIQSAPLVAKPVDTSRVYGAPNPLFTLNYEGLAFDDTELDFTPPSTVTTATVNSPVGTYPITVSVAEAQGNNYSFIGGSGVLTITPAPLLVKAEDKTRLEGMPNPALTIKYTGLVGDDTEDSVCVKGIVQPETVFSSLERQFTYSNVKINNTNSVYRAQPNEPLNLTGNWYQIFENLDNPYCPGCITQLYIGMGNGSGGNSFTECTDVSGLEDHSGAISKDFNAPSTPGIYYITQRTSWYFECYQADQGPIIHDDPVGVIAVIIVGDADRYPSSDKISASTSAVINSTPGNYPITLTGCANYNPNYTVVLENGTLTIEPTCITQAHLWEANNNFNDEFGTGNGTPVGNVTFGGGSTPNFLFDGNSYIATGTGGSVSGTGDFDVSAWVKTTGTEPMVIIQQRDEDIDGEYILKIGGAHPTHTFDPVNTGKAYFMMYDPINNPDVFDVFSTTKVNDGEWHFIKGMRRGTTLSIQVDGITEATVNTRGVVNLRSSIKTFIGSDQRDFASYFVGQIDEVRVSICNEPDYLTYRASSPSSMHAAISAPEVGNLSSGQLYPNPASHSVRVQLADELVNVNGIQVISTTGKVNNTSTRKIDHGIYETNVSGLPKGVYFLKAQTVSGIKTFKFVKL